MNNTITEAAREIARDLMTRTTCPHCEMPPAGGPVLLESCDPDDELAPDDRCPLCEWARLDEVGAAERVHDALCNLESCAHDLQMKRGCPTPERDFVRYLQSYTHASDALDLLPLRAAMPAVRNGFLRAEDEREEPTS